MKKKYLMKTIVAMAIAVVAAGCSRDFDVPSSRLSDDEAMENAEDQLGVTIDPNQTWSMTSTIKAEVTVNRDFGEEYTVTVYQNNPFVNNTGVVLGSSTVKSGQTTNFSFTGQKGTYLVYVAIKDKKGYSYVKPVSISEDKLVAVFGATTRSAADDFEIPALGQPFTTQQVADYLSRATEPNESNISYNHIGDYKEASEGHWVDGTAWSWDWAGVGAQLYYNRTNFDQSWFSPANCGASEEDFEWFKTNCMPFANEDWAFYNGASNKNDASTVLIGMLRNTGRESWANIWAEGSSGHWEEGTAGGWVEDPNCVLDFKITSDYNSQIPVLASEDFTDDAGQWRRGHRDLTIAAKWTLPDGEQRVGGGATIVIANGGELNIPANAYMTFVNQARIVVMPGGKITGAGSIYITNGTAEDGYGYNGGEITIGKFCNNFGTFYNASNMTVGTLEGPSTNSIYINHGKMVVNNAPKSSQTANMRIWNDCWFECNNTLACRVIIQGQGAYLKTGNLEMSCSEDATPDPSYIYAKGNSLLDVTGASAFNNVNIVGPEGSDYAFIQLNYVEDAYGEHNLSTATNYTVTNGVMEHAITNNIYLSIDHLNVTNNAYTMNACEKVINMLNGTNTLEYNKKMADQYAREGAVLFDQQGNGNAVLVNKGAYNVAAVEASECSPGIDPIEEEEIPPIEETNPIYSYAFEDTNGGDYDMNDVVLKVQEFTDGGGVKKLLIKLVAAGATLNLNIRLYEAADPVGDEVAHYGNSFVVLAADDNGETEVHAMFGVDEGMMVNTRAGVTARPVEITIDKGNYDPEHMPFAIYSEQNGEMRLAGAGEAPFGVAVPMDWKWPAERVRISSAYNRINSNYEGDQSFGTFASEAGSALHWYNYPTQNVMDESSLGF